QRGDLVHGLVLVEHHAVDGDQRRQCRQGGEQRVERHAGGNDREAFSRHRLLHAHEDVAPARLWNFLRLIGLAAARTLIAAPPWGMRTHLCRPWPSVVSTIASTLPRSSQGGNAASPQRAAACSLGPITRLG